MPRRADLSNLSWDDLQYAVGDLLSRKLVSSAEVRASAERGRRIAELERQLAALRGGAVRRGPGRPRGPAAAPRVARRASANSQKQQNARKIQGQYLGRLKKLTGKARERVRALARSESVSAAIKLADRLIK